VIEKIIYRSKKYVLKNKNDFILSPFLYPWKIFCHVYNKEN